MKRFESRGFIILSDLVDWLNENQPIRWQVVWHEDGRLYEYNVVVEFEKEGRD